MLIIPANFTCTINLVINQEIFVPSLFVVISILLISKIPTYALKKISVPRSMTIFLLFGIILFFGLILIYTFNAIVLSGLLYLFMIPISYFHYQSLSKKNNEQILDHEEHEDVL